MAIDNPLDAVHSQYDLQPAPPVFNALMAAAAKFDFIAQVANAIRQHFSGPAVQERVEALLRELESEVRRHERSFDDIVNLRMGEGGFRAALMTAAAESAFSESQKKIERFARVLGFELGTPDNGRPAWEDAAAFIRD